VRRREGRWRGEAVGGGDGDQVKRGRGAGIGMSLYIRRSVRVGCATKLVLLRYQGNLEFNTYALQAVTLTTGGIL